jgi:hypothetical protein
MAMEGLMTPQQAHRHYRCRVCGMTLPVCLPVLQKPDGAMRLGHLSQQHPTELGPFLERRRPEDIATVAARPFGGDRGEAHAFSTHSV